MRLWSIIGTLLVAVPAWADVSVTASVDQGRVALGESVTLTIAVQDAQNASQPTIPKVDGLSFAGPSTQSSFSFVNGQSSRSESFVYQVTPTHTGEFVIPAISVNVGGKAYTTEPIKLTVTAGEAVSGADQSMFLRVRLETNQLYLGQTAPLDVALFTRANVPLKGISGFACEANGLGYKYLNNLKSGARAINGEMFNVHVLEGAITPTQTGKLTFGPCVLKTQIAVRRQSSGDWMQDRINEMMGNAEVREQPVTLPGFAIEVLPLPEAGKPADFTGGVGQWNLEVTAKPTEVAVGDPITVTIKITGAGDIDTVATPPLNLSDNFKAYDPTSKTTKNELSTTGERVFQQVLIPKSTDVKELPEIRLSYFDPVAKSYRTAVQAPIKLVVKAGSGGASALVAGASRSRPAERLGEDIVYLKGDLGPAESNVSWPAFWLLNATPVIALAGSILWKRRQDRLRGDVAYARRSRAARQARKILAGAGTIDDVQHALQSYLGDRLNIPVSGLTASVVEERGLPAAVREIFETCDAARFAGMKAELPALKQQVERVIDDLERDSL